MSAPAPRQRLVVGVTGASGAAYALRLLARARDLGLETHLVVTPAGVVGMHHETGLDRHALEARADVAHACADIAAPIASGSFATAAMVVAPCSVKTLAAIAHGFDDNLLTRAADVHLKERRPLVLMVREAPFTLAHLRAMTQVTEMGGIVYPPVPAFYQRPTSVDDIVAEGVERVLALLRIPGAQPVPWQGVDPPRSA